MRNTPAALMLLMTPYLMFAGPAAAQWLDFSDDTATRLQLEPFVDAPGADPFVDPEEKDLAVADLDGDGADDVLIVRKRPFSNPGPRQDVLLMSENGVLVDRTAELAPGFRLDATDARDVFIGDFTGDGWLDVVIANTFGQQPTFYRNAGDDGLGNWLGLVNESTQRLPFIQVPADIPTLQFCALWGGDVTGNGALDLYFSNYDPGSPARDVLFINDGTGNFTNETDARLGTYAQVAFGTGVEIHDVDNDGDQDIVKVSTLYAAPPFNIGQFILFNDGSGLFNTVPYQALPTDDPYMFTVGDLNGDGLMDMYLEGDGQDSVIIAQSATPDTNVAYATNILTNSPRTAGFGGNTKMADVDSDGDLDVGIGPIDVDIANCGFSDAFTLLRNDGNGNLDDPWAGVADQNFHTEAHDFGFLDLNADGCQDMFMALCTGWRVFMQSCESALAAPVTNFIVRSGTLTGGGLPAVQVSDDTYATVNSVLNTAQTLHVTGSFVGARSPQTTISDLAVTVEARTDDVDINAALQLRNFATNGWTTLGSYTLSTTDGEQVFSGVANAADYLRFDGLMLIRVQTFRAAGTRGGNYQVSVDAVNVTVTP